MEDQKQLKNLQNLRVKMETDLSGLSLERAQTLKHNAQLLEACDPENYAKLQKEVIVCFSFQQSIEALHVFIYQSTHPSIHPSIYPSIYPCIHPHVDHLAMYSSIYSLIDLLSYVSINPCIYPFINTSIHSTGGFS